MKKKDIILISIILILLISLIGVIIYYNNDKNLTTEGEILVVGSNYLLVGTTDNEDYVISTKDTNYNIGDKIKLELTDINKNKTPYEAKTKSITIITKASDNNDLENENNDSNLEINNSNIDNNQETPNINDNQTTNKEENYTEEQVIAYFKNLDNELTTYNNNNNQTIGETIKSNFVKCIDFIFYDEEIGGKTFSELTNSTKLKILELTMSIDSKIDTYFPDYKENISSTYQNIKTKIIETYLETTTNICNNDPDLCITAKEGFSKLKDNFGITWDLIKELASNGLTKLKDWYEIWRYN